MAHSVPPAIFTTKSLTSDSRIHVLQYEPYPTSPSTKPFHSLLIAILHTYDTNYYATIQSTTYYPTLQQNITSTHTPHLHRFIITDPNERIPAPHNIRPNNPALLAYTYGLVIALPSNNYSRTTMNIIDHLYIRVLSSPLNTAILDNFTTFAQHQLTQHYNHFASPSSTKPPRIMNIYYDKVITQPLLTHALLAIDIPQYAKFHKPYTQA